MELFSWLSKSSRIKMLKLWRKIFSLPSPVDLGWAKINALELRNFSPFTKNKTWEDYEAYAKSNYPIRYFFSHTFLEKVIWPITYQYREAIYWLKCHLISKNKYHLLDLRNVEPHSAYTYGYLAPCEKMKLAAFACLREYIEEEKPADPATYYSIDEQQDEYYLLFKADYDEAMTIYHWWMIDRKIENDQVHQLYLDKMKAADQQDQELYNELSKKWTAAHRFNEEKEEQMFLRLSSIRRTLWS